MSRGIIRGPDQSTLQLPIPSGEIIPSSSIYIQPELPEETVKENILNVFSPNILSFLLPLKYTNGDSIIDTKSPDHEVLYYLKSVLDEIGEGSFESSFRLVSYNDRYDLLFSHPAYNTAKLTLVNELESKNIPFEIGEGMYQCPNCKGNKTISSSKQTRSADEGEKVRVECTQCGYSWRFNS